MRSSLRARTSTSTSATTPSAPAPDLDVSPGTAVASAHARDRAEPVVAVDCNGADLGPGEVAAGAAIAAREGARVILFGPAAELGGAADGVEVVDAPVSIAKSADPASAVRATPQASIVQAARAVAEGRAHALVCAGGTGAALAAGLFHVKRAHGIYRPALALPLPVPEHPVLLLDVGANSIVRREHLVQFAFMGAALSQTMLDVALPRVGLLSNGEEANRGSPLVREVHAELLQRAGEAAAGAAFEFVGNVEGGDLVAGAADVIVTDGFTGNIALKLLEGTSQTMLRAISRAARSSLRGSIGGALLRGALTPLRREIDPEAQGGAYLLGLRRLGVVPHGRFTRAGFAQAITRAQRGAREDIVGRTARALADAGALRHAPTLASASAAAVSLRESS